MIQPPISEENKHIEEYLVDYFNREDTEYAVMINGPWGTGKTWFIKEIKEKYNSDDHEKLYVSLNGMAKTAAIDAELFRAMHPLLGHDVTKLLAKVGTTLFKVATKVDLNGDGEQETLTISVPTIDTSDLVKNGKKAVLIFDDLERCQIPIKEVLGYINYFVEQKGLKVIVVSDESKIQDVEYHGIKEKIIGTTFLLEGSYINAIDAFLEEKSLSEIKDKLTLNKEAIYDVYGSSGFKNLRSIKQSLQEFSRFYDEDYFNGKNGGELFTRVLKYFLIFSLEFRAGSFNQRVLNFKEVKEGDKNPKDIFFNKYKIPEYEFYVLSNSIWTDIIFFNKLNNMSIKESLYENYYNVFINNPDWYKLWHFEDLSQIDFNQNIESVKNKLISKSCTEIGEVKHIIGLLSFFDENKTIDIDIDSFKAFALDNIRNIFKKDSKVLNLKFQDKLGENDSWSGRGFYNKENQFMKDFFNEINVIRDEEIEAHIINNAPEILCWIKQGDLDKFSKGLALSNYVESLYWDKPVLKGIQKEDFCHAIILLNYEQIITLLLTIRKRYEVRSDKSVYLEEKEWFYNIIDYLENEILPEKKGVEKLKISHSLLARLKKIREDADSIHKVNQEN
ncbi:KAP family NTPase [Acinetobacter sp. ME22]|uniref:P-loop NTPase fold protein n=1 Tax=Acinetobacter sp. ME22 TaxID=2904802 RepID=UPI001EDA77F5|nr:P-loop NTPase fold protein [Acinetobacter sp. ME22]MCG2574200.1 KAP family NTPase [Acinetobacter sp. ME22]